LHLRWDLDDRPGCREVSVNLEVLQPPTVDRLYFWALQADFAMGDAGRRPAGGAHLGLQWHPQHPGSTAVNWGGCRPGGGELSGTVSALPSALGNPNTRDMRWRPGEPYRLTIARAEPTGAAPTGAAPTGAVRWRGSVTDSSGTTTVVRDLFVEGDRIAGVVMWSEVFARCEHPSVGVRWSDPTAVTVDGRVVPIPRVSVNYQSHADGGCANTDSRPDAVGVAQWTAVTRTVAQGTVLAVPGSGAAAPVPSGP
ncbi:MAG TPA: hypothetical protein PK434_12340, partial [Microthrixaceae bacterium]|nr:hypothetical protein [Microthrixaceae bacterium]